MGILGMAGLSALTLTSGARLQKVRTAREQAESLSPVGDGTSFLKVVLLQERENSLRVAGQVPMWLLTAVPPDASGFQGVGKALVSEMGKISESSVAFLSGLREWTVMVDEAYALGDVYLYAASPEKNGPVFLAPLTDGRWRRKEYAALYSSLKGASLMRVLYSSREGAEDPTLAVRGLWERTRRSNEGLFKRNSMF